MHHLIVALILYTPKVLFVCFLLLFLFDFGLEFELHKNYWFAFYQQRTENIWHVTYFIHFMRAVLCVCLCHVLYEDVC